MGGERADDQPVPEEEVLKRETRDVKAVEGSENMTMPMSNPAMPFDMLLTYGFMGHALNFSRPSRKAFSHTHNGSGVPGRETRLLLPYINPVKLAIQWMSRTVK
nr:hypothetical protein HmN_000318100 [Hymenolepis microstoma]